MKTRQTLVSNSSSTSFCIYGKYFEDPLEMYKNFQDKNPQEYKEFVDSIEYDEAKKELICNMNGEPTNNRWGLSEVAWPFLKFIKEKFGTDLNMIYGEEGVHIGINLVSIGDDETGAQFKARCNEALDNILSVPAEYILGSTYG